MDKARMATIYRETFLHFHIKSKRRNFQIEENGSYAENVVRHSEENGSQVYTKSQLIR